MTTFWRNWLTIWGWAVAAVGLLLTGAAFPGPDAPTRVLLGLMAGEPLGSLDDVSRFSIALLGAVTLGWGLTLLAAFDAAHALGREGRSVWARLTTAVLVWWAVDSALSVATGFALNAASNTLFLAGYLVPVLRSGVLGSVRAVTGSEVRSAA
jgi:hypothetical protein